MTNDFEYFPKNYDDARSIFRGLSEKVLKEYEGSKAYSYQVPSQRDQNLFVDYLSIPALKSPETLIIITSGVHGAEAHAGHAAQAMFIKELLPKIPRDNTGVFLVHSLNPFGFKYDRRATENNVNLNRNFGTSEETFKHKNEAYHSVSDIVEHFNNAAGSATLSFLQTFYLICLSLRRQSNPATLNQALSEGQYQFPRGIEYGGATWEPQSKDFIERLRDVMKGYKDILLCDMHTGLGDKLQLHMIPPDDPSARQPELMKKLFGESEKLGHYKYTTSDAEGFYRTYGDMNSLVSSLAPAGSRALGVTLEYGTLGNTAFNKLQVFSRVLNENRGFLFGYKSKEAEEVAKKIFVEVFAPSDKKWRSNVVAKARAIWSDLITRL